MSKTGNGNARAWLDSHLNFTGDACLIWPFKRDRDGYAHMKHGGRDVRVPRIMCEQRHGPPPSPKHEAAHNCGKGHLGCVNQMHLDWKTAKENDADKLIHGTTNRGERNGRAKLTEADVILIRAATDVSPSALARRFGVGITTIQDIVRRRKWTWLTETERAAP